MFTSASDHKEYLIDDLTENTKIEEPHPSQVLGSLILMAAKTSLIVAQVNFFSMTAVTVAWSHMELFRVMRLVGSRARLSGSHTRST